MISVRNEQLHRNQKKLLICVDRLYQGSIVDIFQDISMISGLKEFYTEFKNTTGVMHIYTLIIFGWILEMSLVYYKEARLFKY